ncbi:MAG: DNA replication protein DnaD, partial [Roseburia sp.]|nr:DNA replication protein DnaD [Roseburia sp.]
MPKITIHNDSDTSVTSVSNIFIDEYMSDANGEFVKIYLYLLRLMNAPDASVSLSSIADKFEHTEKDVKRALCYWERMRLLRLEYDENQNL